MISSLALLAALIVGVRLQANAATADQVYHSSHIALRPVAGAPLEVGFVENIHPNGPQVFARERYVLVGASSDAVFDIALIIYATSSGECTGDSFALPSVSVETNRIGNGTAQLMLPPEAIPADLHGATIGIIWQFSGAGGVVYETDCETVTLDQEGFGGSAS